MSSVHRLSLRKRSHWLLTNIESHRKDTPEIFLMTSELWKILSVPEVAVQLPETTKVGAAMVAESGTISGPMEPLERSFDRLRADLY